MAARALGVFAGLGGALHGPGEMLQGNVAPEGVIIQAWPGLTELLGEPAMTIIPSYQVSGILTVIVGIAVAAWAYWFMHRKDGGLVLVLSSVALLLVGGGLFPPAFGIMGGVLGTQWSARQASREHGRAIVAMLSFGMLLSSIALIVLVTGGAA